MYLPVDSGACVNCLTRLSKKMIEVLLMDELSNGIHTCPTTLGKEHPRRSIGTIIFASTPLQLIKSTDCSGDVSDNRRFCKRISILLRRGLEASSSYTSFVTTVRPRSKVRNDDPDPDPDSSGPGTVMRGLSTSISN